MELYLSQFCGENDILTPNNLDGEYQPRNHHGMFMPAEVFDATRVQLNGVSDVPEPRRFIGNITRTFSDLLKKRKFYDHIPAYKLKNRIPDKIWNNYFKFCFERNPWDKSISHYYWRRGRHPEMSFEEYLNGNRLCYNHPIYMDGQQESVIVDFVGYFENLEEDFRKVCEIIGIPFEGLPKVNVSKNRKQTKEEFFSGENKKFVDVIKKLYRKEIELHDYKFDGVVA